MPLSALVTAHKKKRSRCNERERLDPYIVMPICVFGCDHLYERGAIRIINGRVAIGDLSKMGSGEKRAVDLVSGRRLAPQWLMGDATYFE